MGNKGNKILAVVLSCILVMGCIGSSVYAEENKKNETSDGEVDVQKILEEDIDGQGGDGLYKDETVYVIAGAGGEVNKVVVSNWIKNTTNSETITDHTKLKDIVNVKGDETYSMSGEDMCVWDAKGHDIYYQGTAGKAVPVDIKVSYKLDGVSISPEDLAGKSGKVTIRFDYTNNEYKMMKIDGKEEKIYVPFAMLTGFIMDNDIFSNIEITNGKIVNQGESTIVTGLSFPGLQDSLGMTGEDFDIPNYVEITADAKNFEMKNTVTVATSSLFDEFDTSKYDLDTLKEDLDKLKDGMQKLIDGSSELYDGIATLLDKSYDLVEGIRKLTAGAEKLRTGAKRLDDGTANLQDGAARLAAGVNQLKAGTEQLAAKTPELSDGIDEMLLGAVAASKGIGQLNGGLEALTAKSDDLNDGAAQVAAGAAGVDTGLGNIIDYIETNVPEPVKGGLLVKLNDLKDVTEQVKDGSAGLRTGVGQYTAGVAQVAAGAEQLNESAPELVGGASQLSNGADVLNASILQLDASVGQLQTGAGGVYDGTRQIKSGTSEIADGAEQLYKGLMEIDENMPALIEGIEKLNDGAMELSDGLKKFDEEGISKITDLADGDLANAASRIKSVVDVAKTYKSFSGLGLGMDGESKLVYKTDEIKKPETDN